MFPFYIQTVGYNQLLLLHKVCNFNLPVVRVSRTRNRDCTFSRCSNCTSMERISSNTISGLEANLRLETVFSNCTNHLQWDIRAVEHSSIIRRSTFITYNIVLGSSYVCSVGININFVASVKNTSKSCSCVIYV